MTAFSDALSARVLEVARQRAAVAAQVLEQRLRNVAPPCREWIHDEPRRPFPPHEALDAFAFETDDDPGLSTAGAPGYAFVGPAFHVGDHVGCMCTEGVIPREVSVSLVQDGPTRITYRADTSLARVRMVSRPQPAGILVGAGVATFGAPANAPDTEVDDPARRSTWWRDAVAEWPDLLRG